MLMCSFGVGQIIWGLKFQGPKCVICGLKFAVGEIVWGLIFLVCHYPSHFLGNVAKLRPARRKIDCRDDRFLDKFFDPPVGLQH